MALHFDIDGTANAIISAIQGPAKQGWQQVSTLVTNQARMMAHQAAFIAESSAIGALRNEPVLKQMFADQLADSVRGLARDVAALTILTIEKVWNAAVKVLWGAINKTLSGASMGLLMLPTF